jgi:hypothetical protein
MRVKVGRHTKKMEMLHGSKRGAAPQPRCLNTYVEEVRHRGGLLLEHHVKMVLPEHRAKGMFVRTSQLTFSAEKSKVEINI